MLAKVLRGRQATITLSGSSILKGHQLRPDIARILQTDRRQWLRQDDVAAHHPQLRQAKQRERRYSGRRQPALVGSVPQKFALAPFMPLRARDLMELGLDGSRLGLPLPSRARRHKVEVMLDAVDAGGSVDQRIDSLSAGQQQCVVLAHAPIRHPRLLLLDEPLANLDMRSVAGIVALLRRLSRQFHTTVLRSAHGMNPPLAGMDRIIYLAKRRAATGSTNAVVRTAALSPRYGRRIDVVRVHGRILIVAAAAQHEILPAIACDPVHVTEVP